MNSRKYKTAFDMLLLLIIVFQDVRNLNVLHSPLYKYLILVLFGLLTIYYIKNKIKTGIKWYWIVPIIICYAYTIIFSRDVSIIVPMIFLPIEILTLYLYIKTAENTKELVNRLLSVLYKASIILCAFGLVQVFGYRLNIRPLYDFSLYGIIPSYNGYLAEGRFYSIYAEPAHLCGIIAAGMIIGYYRWMNLKKVKYLIAFLINAVFGILTGSVITYISMAMAILACIYHFYTINKKTEKEKKIIVTCILIAIAISSTVFFINSNYFGRTGKMLNNFFDNNSSNVWAQNNTTYAIKSNLSIAVEKMKDGYVLGTGIFSHQVHYDKYINEIYPSRYQIDLNKTDAASLFIRVYSEFGIVGIILFFAFLAKTLYLIIKSKEFEMLIVYIVFIGQSLRMGEYNWILICLPFMLIVNYLYYKKRKEI